MIEFLAFSGLAALVAILLTSGRLKEEQPLLKPVPVRHRPRRRNPR